MTLHADEEMDRDELTIEDIECAILTGEVVERQRDRHEGAKVSGSRKDGGATRNRGCGQARSDRKDGYYYGIRAVTTRRQPVCDMCGRKGVRRGSVTRSYGRGKGLLVIEKVPVVRCPNCGESYFTAETLSRIRRIQLYREGLAAKRPVAVATFR